MSNCAQCGRPLPSFSTGELTAVCAECRQRTATSPEPSANVTQRVARPRPPMTIALIAINVVVFAAMVASGVSFVKPSIADLLKWGADWGPQTLGAQPWRALTSNYLHIGIIHILLNMWCLWNLGFIAERIFGRFTFLLVYTVCGLAGSVASLWWHPMAVGAGASGAIFGIAGALITALYLGKLPVSREALRPTLKSLVSFAVYNLFIGAAIGIVDNSAHIGGLMMGLALGAVLGRVLMDEPDRRKTAEVFLFLAAAVLLLGCGWAVRQSRGEVVAVEKGRQALEDRHADEAIGELEPVVKAHPDDNRVLVLLGRAYTEKKEFAKAEAVLQQAVAKKPDDLLAKFNLGYLYLATQRWEPARQIFSELTRVVPKDEDSWILLGNSLDGLGREPDAVEAYQRCIALNPMNAYAYRDLGLAQLKLKQNDAAIQSLQKALELNPKSLQAQRGLAGAFLAAGRRDDAQAALKKAEELKASGTDSDEE
jgi:rhomboid protease GluP